MFIDALIHVGSLRNNLNLTFNKELNNTLNYNQEVQPYPPKKNITLTSKFFNGAAHLVEDQGMYQVTDVDRFIHLLPEGKGRPSFPCNRCAKLSEPSKQQIHTTKNKTVEGGGCRDKENSNYEVWVALDVCSALIGCFLRQYIVVRGTATGSTVFSRECSLHQWDQNDLFYNYPPLSYLAFMSRHSGGKMRKSKKEKDWEEQRETGSHS